MARKRRSAHYEGTINLVPLSIRNDLREKISKVVNELPFLAYHVEDLADGRKVCITKPGGKSPFGQMKVHDFMVWIYDEEKRDRWRISHEEIAEDIGAKLESNRGLASRFVELLHDVCKGAEPNDLSSEIGEFTELPGLSPDLVLKVYKWIWIQEDCNYPTGEGRWMSMKGILALRDNS